MRTFGYEYRRSFTTPGHEAKLETARLLHVFNRLVMLLISNLVYFSFN